MYRIWLNRERTVMVRVWDSGTVEVCTRCDSDAIWGPPTVLYEEQS